MTDSTCSCGHERHQHHYPVGKCEASVPDPSRRYAWCTCRAYTDARLPDNGERLVFGVHRQASVNAETAEAWPSMSSWSARVKARTSRALRTLR